MLAYLGFLGVLGFQYLYKISNLFLVEEFEVSLQHSEAIRIFNVFLGKLDEMLDLVIIPGFTLGGFRAYRGPSKEDIELNSVVILLKDRVHAIPVNKDTNYRCKLLAKHL